jgi:tetratricopeptide (TPR) repeat protein
LLLRYNEAFDKEDWKDALQLLNRRIALYGEDEDTELKLLDILAKMKDVEKLLAEVKVAYGKYPNSTTFLVIQYMLNLNTNKNLKTTNELLEQYLKKNYDEGIIEELASNYFKLGQKDLAIKKIKQLLEYKPYAIMRYNKLATLYFDMREYDKALQCEQMAIDRAPYEGQFYYSQGVIYEAKGDKTNAIDMYQKAIYYKPTNYEARHKLRLLTGKKEFNDYFTNEDADFVYNKALNDNLYTTDNAVYLLSDEKQIVYPENGASEARHEMLVQALTQSAIDELKELSVPYNSYSQRLTIEKAEILKSDGSKVAAEVQDNYLVFTALEKKDAIHVIYKLEESSTGSLAEHFWHDFTFNGYYPIQQARYSIIVPGNKTFEHKVYNSDVKPVITDVDDYKMYVWEKKNSPPIKEEPSMPVYNDIAERLIITSIPSWNYIANWYSDVSTIKSKADFEIKEKVKEIFPNGLPHADIEKAKTIYNYIEQNFHYSNVSFLQSALIPQAASRTINAKLGDCKDLATLFVALGREVGLNANLVLVDTRNNGYNNLMLPTIGFNHCIAQLHVDGKKYYIELTNNHLPFGTLDLTLLNANGLEIPYDNARPGEAKLVRINTDMRPANTITREGNLSLEGNTAKITRKVLKTGSQASVMRASYKDMDKDMRVKELTGSLSSEFNKNLKIDNMLLTNMEDLNDTVTLLYDFTVDNFVNKIMDMQVFKLPWTESYITHDFVTLDKRNYPLELWYMAEVLSQSEVITVVLPAGKKIAEMPKNVSISCPEMSYKITYEVKPGKLVAKRELKFLKDTIAPESYAGFKEFVTKTNEATGIQIVLR